MKKQILIITTLITILYSAVCRANVPIRGNGKMETITKTLSSFNVLRVKSTYLNVEVVCDKMPFIEITTDANLLPYLTTEVSNRVLTLDNKKGYYLIPTKCHIKVSTEFLNQLETFREALHVSVSRIDTQAFNLIINEGELTSVQLAGKVEELNITNDKGAIDATKLDSKHAKVVAETDKSIQLAVTETLEVSMEGRGTFNNTGNPIIKKSNLTQYNERKQELSEKAKKLLAQTPYIKVKLKNEATENREFYVEGLNPYINKTFGYGFSIKARKIYEDAIPLGSKIYLRNRLGKKLVTITKEMDKSTVVL